MDAPQDTPTAQFSHTTVLLHETVEGVLNDPNGCYVDGTFGRGGHSRLLLSKLGEQGRLIGIDRDLEAIAAASSGTTAVTDARFRILHSPFADMRSQLAGLGIEQVQGRAAGSGCVEPADRQPRARFQLPFQRPAGHAHGHHPWRERRGFPGPRR